MCYEPFCAHLGIRIYRPTWRSTFYLTSGLCLLAIAAGFYSIPPDHVSTEVDKRVDWLGAFLVTVGLVLIVFVLSDGEIAPDQWATSCAYRPFSSMTRLTVDPPTPQPSTLHFTDIIALLVLGVAFMVLFVLWQLYLERVQADPTNPLARAHSKWTPPPLLKMSMWKRANGKFAIMQLIACVNWCSFMSWTFWVQVCASKAYLLQFILESIIDLRWVGAAVVLPKLCGPFSNPDHGPDATYVHHRCCL